MSTAPISILFLCTGNSARSIMAEAIANGRFGDRLRARSAGSHPKPAPHPLALRTLGRQRLSVDGLHSKGVEEMTSVRFDLVVTLCDEAAAERCPTLAGAPARAHWPFPDPPAAEDPEATFETVFAGLNDALARFVQSREPDLARRAAVVAPRRSAIAPASRETFIADGGQPERPRSD